MTNIATVHGQSVDTGNTVSDSDPAVVRCEQVARCDIEVDKTCIVEPPPPTGDLACEAKIAATTLRYIGPDVFDATVEFIPKDKDAGTVTYAGVNLISGVTILTLPAENGFTIDERPNDLGAKMTITINGVEEVIHTSCSTPYVVGLPAPLDRPKGDPSPNWSVVNFVDKNGNAAP